MFVTTPKEKSFIKQNREMLSGIFEKRVEDLKEELLTCPDEDRASKIKMINEFKSWLLTIKIFSKTKKKEKKDDFV